MTKPTHEQVLAVCTRFAFAGEVTDVQVCGNGHINSTYVVTVEGGKRYILQILNTAVFKDPVGVMNNIVTVTDHIRRGLAAAGEDTERGTMRVILTKDGQNGYTDPEKTATLTVTVDILENEAENESGENSTGSFLEKLIGFFEKLRSFFEKLLAFFGITF